MRVVLIIFLLISFNCDILAQNAESNMVDYQRMKISEKIMSGYYSLPFNNEMKAVGLNANPGISNHKYFKDLICDSCNSDYIKEVFVDLWKANGDVHLDAGVMIFNFIDEKSLDTYLPHLVATTEEKFLRKGNLLIFLWASEHEDIEQDVLNNLVLYYEQLGFVSLKVSNRILDISEDELLSWRDMDFTDPKVIQAVARNVKHLFTSENAFIVFYDDGTVSICPECRLSWENINLMEKEEAYSIYLESKDGVVIHSKDQDIKESIVIEFSEPEMGIWAVKDFLELVNIPQ